MLPGSPNTAIKAAKDATKARSLALNRLLATLRRV